MGPIDVRRLAAIDMHGLAGTQRRRVIITVEFVLGAVVGSALGIFGLLAGEGLGWKLFSGWILTACLNYVPLAVHTFSLWRPDALDRELAGVDIPAQLRHYTLVQFWIAVPLLFVLIAIPQAMGQRPIRA